MSPYPKQVLTIQEQLNALTSSGMIINNAENALNALSNIGYYRLRGYSFIWYDNSEKKYKFGVSFEKVMRLYQFDKDLSNLIFSMCSQIEISLRARLVDAITLHGDALALYNPEIYSDKGLYWKNLNSLTHEITRSHEVFIQHHLNNHNGQIPIEISPVLRDLITVIFCY